MGYFATRQKELTPVVKIYTIKHIYNQKALSMCFERFAANTPNFTSMSTITFPSLTNSQLSCPQKLVRTSWAFHFNLSRQKHYPHS